MKPYTIGMLVLLIAEPNYDAGWGASQLDPSNSQQELLKSRGVKTIVGSAGAWAALCKDGSVVAWGKATSKAVLLASRRHNKCNHAHVLHQTAFLLS